MSTLYLICNQDNHFLEKSGEWANTLRASTIYRTVHKDEALNHLLEMNAKEITLRLSIVEATHTEAGIQLNTPLEPVEPEQAANEGEAICD